MNDDRTQRYADAVENAVLPVRVRQVMAVADAEQAELIAHGDRWADRALTAEAKVARLAPSPCCNYREDLDSPCDGTAWLIPGQPTYACDTCGARCGRLVHQNCAALADD